MSTTVIEKGITKDELIRDYTNTLSNGYATVFLGAGMSIDSGLPTWKQLMLPVAKAMKQEIDDITDFYELAEQYIQVHGQRTSLSNLLLEQVKLKFEPSDNHRIITRLPLKKIWTSNFDNLIEKAFEEKGKEVNVISRDVDFTFSRYEQVKLYKIHGCIYKTPEDLVISRRDIEGYTSKYKQMQMAFESALSENTFLFLGFSFDDVNFRTILGRLHHHFNTNQRQHYAILKKPDDKENKSDNLKFNYALNDLTNYGIKVHTIDDYKEISWILKDIERSFIRSNIFISGSLKKPIIKQNIGIAHKRKKKVVNKVSSIFPYKESISGELVKFLSELGYALVERKNKLYSGYGSGVCDVIIEGAAQHFVEQKFYQKVFDSLKIFPLPHRFSPLEKQNKYYREGMIGPCGFMIMARGNTANSDYLSGTIDEYIIAKGLSRLILREQEAILRQMSGNIKPEELKELKVRQKSLLIEKEIESLFLYNRIIREQWKLITRLIGLMNKLIYNIYQEEKSGDIYKKTYLKIVEFITQRQKINFYHFDKSDPFDQLKDKKMISTILVEMLEKLTKPKKSIHRKKFAKYLEAIKRAINADKRYFHAIKMIYYIEEILITIDTEACSKKYDLHKQVIEKHLGNLAKISDKKDNNYFSLKKITKEIFDDTDKREKKEFLSIMNWYINLESYINVDEDFESIKAQRQISKVKDFPNDKDNANKQYFEFEDFEKGIKSVHPFWYAVEDIDKIIEFHSSYIKNFRKIAIKRKHYAKITKRMVGFGAEQSFRKIKDKIYPLVNEIDKIDTNFQNLSYPYRCGTVILPIGCLGGMSYKIWKEERLRFINRFAMDIRFKSKLENGKDIAHYLIESYDRIGNLEIKPNKDFGKKIIKEINFLISAFSPSVTEYELIKLTKKYAGI